MALRPGDRLGQQIRDRVNADLQGMRQRAQARQTRLQGAVTAAAGPLGEQIHQTVQHAESALQGLGTNLMHSFQENNPNLDAVRSQIEGAVNQARSMGFHVNYQNSGGQTVTGS